MSFPNHLLNNIRLILVQPAGPRNVGSIARVMKNMGLTRLYLVNPLCDHTEPESLKMAVHAQDILNNAKILPDLPGALEGVKRAIATTARTRSTPTEFYSPREGLSWLLEENIETALIFGPEDRGLSNIELNCAQRFVSIASNPDYPSLNLAQAVGICAHELYNLANVQQTCSNYDTDNLASIDFLEGYYQQLESTLLKIGYLYPHTATVRMEKLRRLFNKIQLTNEEVTSLRGILRQIDWYVQQKSN